MPLWEFTAILVFGLLLLFIFFPEDDDE